jgi:ACS family hexuronate transporter-like MFS transporter
MALAGQIDLPRPRIINSLRWWIGGILFASTVINYIDRQTLSILAPFLKQEYHWSNTDYANIAIAFRLAYTIGQTVCGRVMDRVGTRRGLTISVTWYSIVSLMTSLAGSISSFAVFRFFLGAGESANWPGASKAVSEWFPKRDRALAAAFYDSGSSVGGAVAPFLILPLYLRWGWRVAFAVPGLLGFLWLIVWRRMYHLPAQHPNIGDAERQMILAEGGETANSGKPRMRLRDLLKLPQTWGTIISKGLTDRLDCRMDSVSCRGPGQLLWRRRFGFFDSARMATRRGTKSAGCLWGIRCTVADPDGVHGKFVFNYAALWTGHVFVRFVFHHRQRAAYGPLRE